MSRYDRRHDFFLLNIIYTENKRIRTIEINQIFSRDTFSLHTNADYVYMLGIDLFNMQIIPRVLIAIIVVYACNFLSISVIRHIPYLLSNVLFLSLHEYEKCIQDVRSDNRRREKRRKSDNKDEHEQVCLLHLINSMM